MTARIDSDLRHRMVNRNPPEPPLDPLVTFLATVCLLIAVVFVGYYAIWFGWHPEWMQDQWANRCHTQQGQVVGGGRNGNDLCVLPDGRVAAWRAAT